MRNSVILLCLRCFVDFNSATKSIKALQRNAILVKGFRNSRKGYISGEENSLFFFSPKELKAIQNWRIIIPLESMPCFMENKHSLQVMKTRCIRGQQIKKLKCKPARWRSPVIPATPDAEAGRSFEPKLKPAWGTKQK